MNQDQELVKVTYVAKDLIKVTEDGIPFIIASDKEELMKFHKVIRSLISLCDGSKKGPGRPSQAPKNISQRLGVVKVPNDADNIIEAEIHYPESFQKFICGVLKSACANYVYFQFDEEKIVVYGDHEGSSSRLEMRINCNRLTRYYCQNPRLVCVQREYFDVIKTSNGKIHSKIHIYIKKDTQDTRMYIATDMGHDKGTTSDVSMSLSSTDDVKEFNFGDVNTLATITMQSQFLKNEVSSCGIANQAEFILKHDIVRGERVITPMIKAYNSYVKDSKSLEKTIMLPQSDSNCKLLTDRSVNIKVTTNHFKQFISMMSRFASIVNLRMGVLQSSGDGVIVFEMQCDNEENNIFCVDKNDLDEKIKHLYGTDYECRCYCINRISH